tara:strand:- start:3828 stop:4868 length:1041 start_codon:yes stop_codon:yes gene_type:complete
MGKQNQIPIKNIFHMLCYSWNVLDQQKIINVDDWEVEKPVDLFARVLISGTKYLLRYGIGKQYQDKVEAINSIRGRVDIVNSMRRMLPKHGKAICSFDDFSVDNLNNQIIKATLKILSRDSDLDAKLRHETKTLIRGLNTVKDIKLANKTFSQISLNSHTRTYRLLLNICNLIFHQSLLNPEDSKYQFRDFVRDERKMAIVYEKFLYNFYKSSQSDYDVSRDRIRWDAHSPDDPGLSLLPTMNTDITLRCMTKTIVIDAKYYRQTLNDFRGSKKLHSTNLYQIFAYLENIKEEVGIGLEGLLLYPVTDEAISNRYIMSGKLIRVETIDLMKSWESIEIDLLSFLNK